MLGPFRSAVNWMIKSIFVTMVLRELKETLAIYKGGALLCRCRQLL